MRILRRDIELVSLGALLASALCGADSPMLVDVAEETGLRFEHSTGARGDYRLPEIMSGGVGLFDADGDGDLDVYLIQGQGANGDRLFLNLLVETGKLRFADATLGAGIVPAPADSVGMGAAAGDYDGDGDVDLFVSRHGPDSLQRNNGDGTFTDVAPRLGLNDSGFGASAVWLDYDSDSRLDLFLARYVSYLTTTDRVCRSPAGGRDYCSPLEYRPLPDRLYRNRGADGFENAAERAGIDAAFGNGLGATAGDFDRNGHVDIFVANDKTANQLWINQRDGTFVDDALYAGAAYNLDGMAEAGMGASAGDFDQDGDLDLFMTHIQGETNTLYRNEGDGLFEDITNAVGLGQSSVFATGFGVGWFDVDNDGDLDLFAANGGVTRYAGATNDAYPYDQPNQVWLNEGGRFRDVSVAAGAAVTRSLVSRGAAFGDIDNDGDVDIVVNNAGGPAQLLLNRAGDARGGLTVEARGAMEVVVEREGMPQLRLRPTAGGGYLSSNDPRAHFGLGETAAQAVAAIWPDGAQVRVELGESARFVRLKPPAPSP